MEFNGTMKHATSGVAFVTTRRSFRQINCTTSRRIAFQGERTAIFPTVTLPSPSNEALRERIPIKRSLAQANGSSGRAAGSQMLALPGLKLPMH